MRRRVVGASTPRSAADAPWAVVAQVGALVLSAGLVAPAAAGDAGAAGPAMLAADDDAVDSAPLPLATATVPASTAECAVWRRERSFARSIESHDIVAFASHVDAGAVFDAGATDATRGRDAIVAGWKSLVEEQGLVLRWRPGVVDIGGDPSVALSRGPYILQMRRVGHPPSVSVGLYQTVWRRDADGAWHVLFDGNASPLRPVENRAAADAWVRQQSMSDCAAP